MKNVFILLLLCTTSLSTTTTNPKLITLRWKASEIVNDSEGKNLDKHQSSIHIFPQIRSEFVQNSHYEIRQIDENSFVVLGSPLEWEGRNVK